MEGIVAVFQCLAVASLSGKGYIERERAAKRESVEKLIKRRDAAEKHFLNVKLIAKRLVAIGTKFLIEYKLFLECRSRSVAVLASMVQKLRELEKQILTSDCAAGSFGFAGGCMTVAGLALAPFTAGASAVVAISGLSIEGISCVCSLTTLVLRLYGTERCTKGAAAIVSEDRDRTERLATLCKELVDVHAEFVENVELANEMIHEMGVTSHMTRFTRWPRGRTLDVVFNSGETLGGWNVVTLEALHMLGLLGEHSVAHAASAAAVGSKAARAVVNTAEASGAAVAEAASVGGSSATTIVASRTARHVAVFGAQRIATGALLIGGMSLGALAAVRAVRKIHKGCHSEVGEIIEHILEDLHHNTNLFLKFHADNRWIDDVACMQHTLVVSSASM